MYLDRRKMQTLCLKRQYDEFTIEQKRVVRIYLAWMFIYSMWMRFCKGPGYPWPLTKVNVCRERDRSSPGERDEHIFIQEAVRTSLIESFEDDPVLLEWINGLPAIYYDFNSKEAKCTSYPIKQTLDQIALEYYCMGFGWIRYSKPLIIILLISLTPLLSMILCISCFHLFFTQNII